MRKLHQPLKAPSLSPPSHQVSTYLDKQQRKCEQFYLSFPHSRSRQDEVRQRCNFSSYYEQVSDLQQITNQFKSNNWNLRNDNEKHKKQIQILNNHITKLQRELSIYQNQQVNKLDNDNNKLMQGYQKKAKERKAIMKKLYSILKTKEQEIEELSQSFEFQINDMNNKMIQLQEQCNSQLFQQEDKIKQLEQVINSISCLKQSKLQELEIQEQKIKDIIQKLIKKQESKDKIDEVKNILTFITKEKQKYLLKLPDFQQQQNNLSKEYQTIVTQYESLMMQINSLNQLICQQIKPEFTCTDSIYQLSQNIKEILKQNINLFQEVKEMKEQSNKSVNKLEKYKKQIELKNEQIEQLKIDIKKVNTQLQNQETINYLNEFINISQQQIEILQQKNIEQNQIIEQNEQIRINQQEKENQLLQEIKMIKCEKTISLQQDEDIQIKYKNIINDLQQKIDDLNMQLDNMYTEQAQVQQQIDQQEIEFKQSQIQQKNTIQRLQLEVQKYQQQIEENKQQFNQQIKLQQQQHKQVQQDLINNQNQIQNQLNEYLQIIENQKNKENLNTIFENLIDNLTLAIKQKLLQNLQFHFSLGSSPIRGITKISSPTRQILYHYNNQLDISKIHTTLDNISEQFQNRLNILIKKDEKNQELIQHYCKQIEESQQTIQQLCDENDQQKQLITQMCKHLNIENIQELQQRKSSLIEQQSFIETLNQNNTQIQHLISYNQQFQQDIQKYKIIIKDYEIQIDHLQNQIKYLIQEQDEQYKLTTQIVSPSLSNTKEYNIKKFQNEDIYNKDQQIQVLNDKISILNIEISNLEHQLDSQIKLVQLRNEEIQNLISQLRDLLEKQQYLEQLINELNIHNQQQKNQEEIQIIKLEGVSYDNSRNSFNFDALRTPTNQNYIIDEIKQEQSINSSLSQIAQIGYNQQIKQIIKLNKQQEEDIISKNQSIQEQKIHLEKQNEEINELKSVNSKNQQQIYDLKSQITHSNEKIQSLLQEYNQIQKHNEEKTKQMNIEKQSSFDQIELYKKEIQGVNSRNDELSIQIAQLEVQLQKNVEQQQQSLIENQKIICEQKIEIQLLKNYFNQNQIQISLQNLQIQNLQEKKKLILKIIQDYKTIYYEQSDYIKTKLFQEQQIQKQNYIQLEAKILEAEEVNQKKIANDQMKIFQLVQQRELIEMERKLLLQQNVELQEKYQILENSTLEKSQFINELNVKLISSIIQLEQKDKQLKQIQFELQEMYNQKDLTNQNINTLQLEINQLKQILDQQLQKNNLIYELNKQNYQLIQQKESHIKILQDQLQDLQIKYEELIQSSYKNEQSLNVQILDKQSQILLFESKLKEVSENLEIHQNEFYQKIDLIQKENFNLKEKDLYNIMKIQQLEVNEDLINKQLIALESELINITNELQIKISQINQINSDDNKLQDNLEQENQISQDLYKDQKNKMCELEIKTLKQTLQKLDNKIIRVIEQLKSSNKQNKVIHYSQTERIQLLESQIFNLEKEKLLLIESNQNFNKEKQNYLQQHIKQEQLNNEMEDVILQQKDKIQQLECELQREYERSKQKQDFNYKEIDQQIYEKNEQIGQQRINNENLVQQILQISKQCQMDIDKLKSILNTKIDLIEQLDNTIKKYQKQLEYVSSEKEIIILSFQETEKKNGNLIQQNENYMKQIQQQRELIQQQQQQLIICKEDLKQKTNSITDLQNQLIETNQLSSQKIQTLQEQSLDQQQMIEQYKKDDILQLEQLRQLQDQLNQCEIILQTQKNELNQLKLEISSMMPLQQLIEIKLNEMTQKELKQIELCKQEIDQLNQEKQDLQKKLENSLQIQQQLQQDQTQKVNQMTLKYQQEINHINLNKFEIQKVSEEQQNQLIIQIQQEQQKQNSQIAEINKVQNNLNEEMSKNQSLINEKKRLQKYLSQSNLDKELMNDIQQMEQGVQLINCDENKSLIQENSDRQQCVSALNEINSNLSQNFENQMKSSCNQNQKIIVLQDKIAQLYDENDKLQRQQLQNLDDFMEISPLKESEMIIQLREEIDNLKAEKAQGKAKSELQQDIVKLEKKLFKKDEEIQFIRKGSSSSIYIEMCEKAIIQNRDWMIDLNNLDESNAQRWRIICNKLVECDQLQGEIMKNQNEIQELQLQIKNKENLSLRSIIMKQSQSFDDEDIFSMRSTVTKLKQELEQEKVENTKLQSYLKSYLKDEQRFEEQNQRVKEENKSLRNRIYDLQEEIKQLNEKIQNCQDGALASHLISLLIKFFESLQKENKQEIKVYYQSLMSLCRIEYNEYVINKLFQCVEKKNQGVFGIFRRDKTKDK